MKKLFTLTIMCMMMFCGFAQDPGTLDETFGDGGTVMVSPSAEIDMYPTILVQNDGKILMVSKSRPDGANYVISVSRQNPDGSIDETYGTNGFSYFQPQPVYLNEPFSAVLGDNGMLYITGHIFADEVMNKAYILCVDENGFANPYFGEEGYVMYDRDETVFESDMTVDSEGRIYVAGWTAVGAYDYGIIQRYTAEGELDKTWGNNGNVLINVSNSSAYIYALQIVEDDKLLVGGLEFIYDDVEIAWYNEPRVWKLNTDGSFDTSFADNGWLRMNVSENSSAVYDLGVQPDGSYIIAGYNELPHEQNVPRGETYVTRISKDGVLDATFGEEGYVRYEILVGEGRTTSCKDIVVAHDGQIFGTVTPYDYIEVGVNRAYVFNITAEGQPNEDFAGGLIPLPWNSLEISAGVEVIEVQSHSVTLQNDGKLLVAGYVYDGSMNFELAVSRYHTSVAPLAEPEEGPAEIEMTAELLTETSVKLTITPNEFTSEYFYGIFTKAQYEEDGEEACAEYLYEFALPTTKGGVFEIEDLEKQTDYYAMAYGYNIKGERGAITLVPFTTNDNGFEDLNDARFMVYPNPATSTIFVETSMNNAQVSIIDLTGRTVKAVELTQNASAINIEDVENGVYFIMIQNEDNRLVEKLIVR